MGFLADGFLLWMLLGKVGGISGGWVFAVDVTRKGRGVSGGWVFAVDVTRKGLNFEEKVNSLKSRASQLEHVM